MNKYTIILYTYTFTNSEYACHHNYTGDIIIISVSRKLENNEIILEFITYILIVLYHYICGHSQMNISQTQIYDVYTYV